LSWGLALRGHHDIRAAASRRPEPRRPWSARPVPLQSGPTGG